MESVLNPYALFLMGHIFGVALGAGGAYASDLIFFNSAKDRHISKTESRLLSASSKMVWLGLGILILSGIGLVSLRPEIFLSSEKFWAKMTVVGVIMVNGLVFHFSHLPRLLRSHVGEFAIEHELVRHRTFLLASGAVSVVSWTYAMVLGVIKQNPFSYLDFVGTYAVLLLLATASAIILRERIIPSKRLK